VSALAMSVLSVGRIVDGIPQVLVITVTMWTKKSKALPEPRAWESRTDAVFGVNSSAVCLLACECKRGCDDELT